MTRGRLVLAGAFVLADATCIAPAMPGPAGCSECADAERQQSHCVRDDRWFDCYADVEACCRNHEVLTNMTFENCVRESNKQTVCDDFVALDETMTNRECQKDCKIIEAAGSDPTTDAELGKHCKRSTFEIQNNRVVLDDDCFSNWVYGYSEPADLSGYKVVEDVDTPALCQALCQEDPSCVRFLWAYDSVKNSQYDNPRRCSLKNATQVQVPTEIRYTSTSNPPNFDADYCNYEMARQCFTGHYQCKECQGTLRCIWWSDKHVAGWRYCPDTDSCDVPDFSTTTTAKPKSTTTTKPDTEPTTHASKHTTEAPTKHTTEAPTKHTTEAPTKHTTEAPTKHTTEAPTKHTTEAPTKHTTEAPTKHTTEAPTKHTTEAPTKHTTGEPTTAIHTTTKEPTRYTTATTDAVTTKSTSEPCSTTECDDHHHHHHHHHHRHCHECCHECHGGCHHCQGCDDCKEQHGLSLKVHDQPKMIRIAVDQ